MSILRWKDGLDWWMRFDAVTVEGIERDAEVSTYPVEDGAILSDHYQPQPRRITLTGMVSDTPAGPNWGRTSIDVVRSEKARQPQMVPGVATGQVRKENLGRGAAGVLRPISTTVLPSRRLVRANIERASLFIPPRVSVLQAAEGTPVNRITTFVLTVDDLMERRIPVTVVLSGGLEFDDMMITSHSAPRVTGSGGSVRVRMDLQQITAANPAETVKGSQVRVDPAFKSEKAKGTEGGRTPDAKNRVLLDKLANEGFRIVP